MISIQRPSRRIAQTDRTDEFKVTFPGLIIGTAEAANKATAAVKGTPLALRPAVPLLAPGVVSFNDDASGAHEDVVNAATSVPPAVAPTQDTGEEENSEEDQLRDDEDHSTLGGRNNTALSLPTSSLSLSSALLSDHDDRIDDTAGTPVPPRVTPSVAAIRVQEPIKPTMGSRGRLNMGGGNPKQQVNKNNNNYDGIGGSGQGLNVSAKRGSRASRFKRVFKEVVSSLGLALKRRSIS